MNTVRPAVPMLVTALFACSALTSCFSDSAPNKAGYVWQNVVTGGGGGFVDGIVFHPKMPDLIYCRTDIGGVYRWNPATSLWIPLTDWVGQDNGNLRGGESIAVDPTDPNKVYVAAGTYLGPDQLTAILRSDDQGRTWKQTPLPGIEMGGNEDGRGTGERLAVDPNNPSIIYFGSRLAGLWRSDNSAVSFTKVSTFPTVPNDPPNSPGAWHPRTHAGIDWVVFDQVSGKPGSPTPTIYAGIAAKDMPAQVYRSADAGQTWAPVPGQPTGFIPHHAAFDKSGVLYITYADALGPNGAMDGAVWKYDTHTSTWTDISPEKALGLPQSGGYGGLGVDYSDPGIVTVATLDHWSPADDVYRTTDGGKSWVAVEAKATMIPTGAPWLNWGKAAPRFGWWLAALAVDPWHHGRVLFGTGATIWGTEDITPAEKGQPTKWVCYGNGIEETAVTALLCPPSGPLLISGVGDIGGFIHYDLGATPPGGFYLHPTFNTTSSIDFAASASNVIVRAGDSGDHQYGGYSVDTGATWNPFPNLPAGAKRGGSIAVTADGKTILWCPQGSPLSYSTDMGQTWSPSVGIGKTVGSQSDYFGQGSVTIITDRADPKVVYLTGAPSAAILASGDSGHSFSPVRAIGLTARPKINLTASFDKAGDLWAQQGNDGLFHSTDFGATFTKLASVSVADGFAVGKAAPGSTQPTLYLVGLPSGLAIHGVYRSDDNGATWLRINDEQHQYGWIGRPIAADLRVYGRVFVGTNGRGIVYGEVSK